MKNNIFQIVSVAGLALLFSTNLMASEAVGEKTYQQACAMCHTSGIAGAPVFAKKADWVERLKKDKEELVNSAINGLGAMPAKGGQMQLSDEDITAAVEHMLKALEKSDEASTEDSAKKKVSTPPVPVKLSASQEQGKAVAFDRRKGNCLACHQVEAGEFPGNSAPPLSNMKVRYPDRQSLRDQIADATVKNPNSIMPPFGRHQILTEKELDLVAEYIHAL